jgi:hypothetical protein
MARTRSTKASGEDSKEASQSRSSVSRYQLDPPSDNPPKLFVLPKQASKTARIVTLPHPRTLQPSRYLLCPDTGFYEFKKIAAPKSTPRSWFIHNTVDASGKVPEDDQAEDRGYVTASADLFIATSIDPLFIVLPALTEPSGTKKSDEKKSLFLTSEDYFDKLPQESSHLSEILKSKILQATVESRMGAICDTVDAGDETMFRLNEKKLLSALIEKARSMSASGLPPTMEDKFVKKPLEAPLAIQKRPDKAATNTEESNKDSATSTPVPESVVSTDTKESSASNPSTANTSFVEDQSELKSAIQATPEITALQRLRVAFDFICSSYIKLSLANHLQQLLRQKDQGLDFTPLDNYLAEISKIRSEALAIRSIGDYSRKHGHDEEEDEIRAEKKRKLEEEKRKKVTETRGVRELKKVNTSGMKKLSAFFKKK